MKKYFIYEFKKSVFLIGVLSAIAVALCLVQFISISHEAAGMSSITSIVGLGGYLAFFLPFWIFSYKMKKRSVDLFYALPLSHTKIIIVKFLVGLVILFIPYAVSYWLSFLILAGMAQWINVVYYIPMFFASIIPLYLIYTISAFMYTRANRRRDGHAFSIFWFAAVPIALWSVLSLSNIGISEILIAPVYFFPAAPLYYVVAEFSFMATGSGTAISEYITVGYLWTGFTFVTLWGIASTVGLILLEKKAKAENTEQISDSWFGYKVLIPWYGVCLSSLSTGLYPVSFFFIVLIFICLFATAASYRRTVKIGWVQLAIIVGSIILGVILHYLGTI